MPFQVSHFSLSGSHLLCPQSFARLVLRGGGGPRLGSDTPRVTGLGLLDRLRVVVAPPLLLAAMLGRRLRVSAQHLREGAFIARPGKKKVDTTRQVSKAEAASGLAGATSLALMTHHVLRVGRRGRTTLPVRHHG